MPYIINELYYCKSDSDYNLTNAKMNSLNCNRNIEVYEDGKKFIIIRQKVNNSLIDWMIPMED